MYPARIAFASALFAASFAAHAQIFECVDATGNKRFTNIEAEAKGCKQLNIGSANPPPPSSPAPAQPAQKPPQAKGSAPTPANFPRVDAQTQQQRDSARRRILEQELGNEQRLLDQARRELSEQQATRSGDERNYQRVLDRLEPFQKRVKVHEDNIANLRREIANLR